MWLKKEVEVEFQVDFDDIKDEFEEEILGMINDEAFCEPRKELLANALRGNANLVATAINIIVENGNESEFSEIFHALSDGAKAKFKELFAYYGRYENERNKISWF